jgi:hypothetical protein
MKIIHTLLEKFSLYRKPDSVIILTHSLTTDDKNMSNYTPEMVAKIEAAAPLNLSVAKNLAADFGLSHRSVISKAKSLGVEYVKAAPAAKRATGASKSDLVAAIQKATNADNLDGLEKATARALSNLLASLA